MREMKKKKLKNKNQTYKAFYKMSNIFLKNENDLYKEKIKLKILLKHLHLYKKHQKTLKFINSDEKLLERYLNRDFTNSRRLDFIVGCNDETTMGKRYSRIKETFKKQKQYFVSIEPKTKKNEFKNFTFYFKSRDHVQKNRYLDLFKFFIKK